MEEDKLLLGMPWQTLSNLIAAVQDDDRIDALHRVMRSINFTNPKDFLPSFTDMAFEKQLKARLFLDDKRVPK